MSDSIEGTPRGLSGRDFDYLSFAQFVLLHAGCALLFWSGVSAVAAGACLAFYCLRIFGLSAGYHRYFSHLSYRTGRRFQFLLAFLGAMAYQRGPLWWVAHHRRHHLHADRTGDIHSPVERGFWWAHCGWIFSSRSRWTDERMVPDLGKYPELRLLDRFYMLPPLMLAVSTYLLGVMLERRAPGLRTNGLQMLTWGFFVSTVLVHHATYSANSLGHLFGGRRFDTKDRSRNNLFVALITFGDGWHNNHHHYPPSARHGFYWWEIDITLYVLRCLGRLGLVWGLKSPPERVYRMAWSGKPSLTSFAGVGGGANGTGFFSKHDSMSPNTSLIRRNARVFMALLVVTSLFLALRYSLGVNHEEVKAAAARFSFKRSNLPELAGPPARLQRRVHRSVERISSFLSTVGAAVALNDLDGDGLSNDACYIDTRTDQVIVAPVKGTGDRYAPFALDQGPFFERDRMAPLGVLPSDVNEDGRVDLIVYYAGRTPLIFLHRPTESATGSTLGADSYTVRDIFPQSEVWMTTSATTADLDGDGHLDLIFANYFKDGSDLYNPEGGGGVELPDSFSHATNGGGERIFRWAGATRGENASVTYEEVTDALPQGVGGGWGLAVGAQDLDGDLLPEVYVAHDFGPDRLFWNRSTPGHIRFSLLEGERRFDTPKSYVLGQDSFKSMGVDFGDLNGDGIPDIYVSNITAPGGLQESQMAFISTGETGRMRDGVAPYVNRSEALGLARSGWAWDAKLDDFDNDGVLEAIQATGFIRGDSNRWPELQELGMDHDQLTSNVEACWPLLGDGADISGHDRNPFFVRAGDHYVNVAPEIGFGEDYVSRGLAIADVDYDGSLDIVVSNMWGPATFYHNECPRPGAFLGLRLLLPVEVAERGETAVLSGPPTNEVKGRAAVGASVTVWLADGRVLTRQVDGGNGHSGKRGPDLHFGLGETRGPVGVRVDWRDSNGQVRREYLKLWPGWHTLLLGRPTPGGES